MVIGEFFFVKVFERFRSIPQGPFQSRLSFSLSRKDYFRDRRIFAYLILIS